MEPESVELTASQERAVRELMLKLVPGAIVALVGPFGSGKTTLAQAVMTDFRRHGRERTVLAANGTSSLEEATAWLQRTGVHGHRALLVVDDAKLLFEGSGGYRQVARFLSQAAASSHVATLVLSPAWPPRGGETAQASEIVSVPVLPVSELTDVLARSNPRLDRYLCGLLTALTGHRLRETLLLAQQASSRILHELSTTALDRDLETAILSTASARDVARLLDELPLLKSDAQGVWEELRAYGALRLPLGRGRT
jgi:energy-coupling factor transporter ATP-binding protein EcfA2